VIISFAVPAFIFAEDILREWVGSSFAAESTSALQILVLTYAAFSLSVLPYYLTLGFGRPQISALINVVAAVINVALIFILIPRYDVVGAASAYLVSAAVVPFLIVYVERRLLEFDASPWPGLMARLAVVAVVQIFVCLLLRPLVTGVAALVGVLALSLLIAPAVAVLTGYVTSEDRATIMRFVVPIQRLVRGSR
jgi:O-antigen/teichoic acid export membrane protein